MITIYHNPRCSKSRESIAFLEEQGVAYKIIKYLEANLTQEDINKILLKLNFNPIELIRTKDAFWQDNFSTKELTNNQLIEAMQQYPQLIERPIVINGSKAVIARPTQKIYEIL